jgi:alcohol dehydrogenase (cytochrome c)
MQREGRVPNGTAGLWETLRGGPDADHGSFINAPPMTFAVGDKQYLAIQTGLNRNALNINSMAPELRDMRNQTMPFVFGL